MIKKIILFFLLSFSAVLCQEEVISDSMACVRLKNAPLRGFGGISFTNSVPQGEMYSNLSGAGLGFSLYGAGVFSDFPLAIGGEMDFLIYDYETKYFNASHSGWDLGEDTVETKTLVLPLTVFVRLQPSMGRVSPYLEAFGGCNLLIASADYNAESYNGDSKNKFSASFAYGLGAGLMFRVADIIMSETSKMTINIDLRMRYSFGTNADVSTVKIFDDSSVEFTTHESRTNMINTLIGVSFGFNSMN